MTATMTHSRPRHDSPPRKQAPPGVQTLAVTVVDGNGIEVYGEPVTARLTFDDGVRLALTGHTGPDGFARFAVRTTAALCDALVEAAGERTGPMPVGSGAQIVVEV